MAKGGDFWPLLEPKMMDVMIMCGNEADWIKTSAEALYKVPKDLITLATGAFCGGQQSLWERIWTGFYGDSSVPRLRGRVIDAAQPLLMLMSSYRRNAFYCHRVNYGPLMFTAAASNNKIAEPGWTGAHGLEHRYHTDRRPGLIPAITGGRSRYYCSFKALEKTDGEVPEREMQRAGVDLAKAFGEHYRRREEQFAQIDQEMYTALSQNWHIMGFNVDIYLSTAFTEPDLLSLIKFMVEHEVEGELGRAGVPMSRYGDVINYKKLEEAPPCEACGWCVEDEEVSLLLLDGG